jgi:glycosyltransferase involved in cell wall biosynthesis
LEYLKREEKLAQRKSLAGVLVKNFARLRRWVFWNILQPDHTITWLPFAALRGRKVANDEDISVIFATCPPHAATLIGAVIKLLTGKPLLLDFRDDWIDTPWYQSKPAMLRWADRVLEKWAVHTADKVVLVTEWSRRAFQNRYSSQPQDKFILVPNGVDLGEFEALNSIVKTPRSSKFTILHAGSLNVSKVWGRSPAGLFQAIQKTLQEYPELGENLSVVFAGDFPEEFRKLAEEMGLSAVIQGVGHLPHDEVLNLSRSADLLLAMNYEGWDTLIPGKIYEYWAVGGPPILLLSCPGAATDFIKQHDLGFSIEPYDVDGIKQAILNVYRQNKSGMPLRIKTDGVEAFDRKSLTGQLAQVLSMISLDGSKRS